MEDNGNGWRTSLGNHRFSVDVSLQAASQKAVVAVLPWRRHDSKWEAKDIIVVNGKTHIASPLCAVLNTSTATEGHVAFNPAYGSGTYHLYYMPFKTCELDGCKFSGNVEYLAKTKCVSQKWWETASVCPTHPLLLCTVCSTLRPYLTSLFCFSRPRPTWSTSRALTSLPSQTPRSRPTKGSAPPS